MINKENESCLNSILRIILSLIGLFIGGWVLTCLWGMFISPLFGLPLISIPVAMALIIIVQFLTMHQTLSFMKLNNDYQEEAKRMPLLTTIIEFIMLAFLYLFSYLFGYILYLFS